MCTKMKQFLALIHNINAKVVKHQVTSQAIHVNGSIVILHMREMKKLDTFIPFMRIVLFYIETRIEWGVVFVKARA